ncbi:hypothetical protein MUU74_16145 [Chryseobacterium daecheongense]|nr:hypothetical protein [Chryseobacterium daecheongense]UOU98012.1 hypothetical protein MUU74_16145 [Chryseobacterium daecheongense]
MKQILLFLLLTVTGLFSAQTCPVATVPFSESFSSGTLPSCWTNTNPSSTSTNALWKFSGSAGYGATGNGGKPAGTFAWVDASSPYDNLHNVELTTPQINLTGLTAPYVEFEWFKNHLTSSTGSLPPYDNNVLKVLINDGSGWVQIFSNNTNDPEWRTVGIPLATTYIGATIQLRFVVDKDAAGNGYFYDDVLLDEVKVKQAPTCFPLLLYLLPTLLLILLLLTGLLRLLRHQFPPMDMNIIIIQQELYLQQQRQVHLLQQLQLT